MWTTAVGAGLVGTSLILGPSRGALGLLGAMAVNAGRDDPLRRRLRVGGTVGLATLLCEAVGLLISPYPWLIPPVMTAVTLAVVWTWHGLQIGPPGPINTVFAGAFGSFMGARGTDPATLLGTTALAWAIGMLASLALLSLAPHAAERRAVEAAEHAVAAYCQADPDTPGNRLSVLRSRAWRAVDDAWHVLRTGRTPGTVPVSAAGQALEERLRAAHLRLLTVLHRQSFPTDHLDIADHFDLVPMGLPSARYLLRTAALPGSRALLVSTRAAAAVLLASSVAYASPVGHPYWAILSSLIVLHMGASRADLTIRAAHRVVGTGIGVLAYVAIVAASPGPWVQIVIVIVAIYGLEALVTRNYAVAVVFVTVFALMLTPVASEAQALELVRDRFVETVIGAGAASLVIWLGSRRAPILLVRRQYRLTLQSLLACLSDLAAGRADLTQPGEQARLSIAELAPVRELSRPSALDPVRTHRRHLVFELGRAGALLAAQQPDAPAALAPWNALQQEVSALGYDVVAATWRPAGAGREAAARARDELASIIDALPPISRRNIDPTALATEVATLRRRYLAHA